MTFLRFVTADRDERTGQPMGLMTLAYMLIRSGELIDGEEDALRGHVKWLETCVPIPDRFARKRNVSHKETHGLSWMKSSASDPVRHLYAITEIARRHDHPVEGVQTERPGYVVYEDEWQVVAEPFHVEQR